MSIWHLLILFFIILLIFGPQRLEGIGGSLGRAVRGFKKGLEGEDELSKPVQLTDATHADANTTDATVTPANTAKKTPV